MTDQCCDNSGGRVTITLNGKRYQSRGGVDFMPTGIVRDVIPNDDGTIAITTKAVPAEATFSLSDRCGLDINELIFGCKIDVVFDQLDMRRKILYTQATVIGRPSFNSDSGVISGLKIAAPASNVNILPY